MDDPAALHSSDHLRPLQPLLSSVAEDASHLASIAKHEHDPELQHQHELGLIHSQHHHHHHHLPQHDQQQQQQQRSQVDPEAESLQRLQSAVEAYDHYTLQQQQQQQQQQHQDGVRPLRQENTYGALMPQEHSVSFRAHQQIPNCSSSNESIFSSKENGYLRDLTSIVDPLDLEAWRERLFHVDETIVLSEEQFRTYFPHIDNVYSHRSTQHYKRKPLVSHYWDCRLKGRPPGTPKSDDPNKKKRKRTARQRDLCDVKIKITEYFPGYAGGGEGGGGGAVMTAAAAGVDSDSMGISISSPGVNGADTPLSSESLPGISSLLQCPVAMAAAAAAAAADGDMTPRENQPFGVLTPNPPLPEGHPGANGQRYFTIQRVNGNGANGKNDGVSGGHRHTLEESDRVKKNSVQRYLLKEAREKKKSVSAGTMSIQNLATPKTYHTKATGLAAATALDHSKESDLKLYGSCFCPFVQRVWIALELKGIPYQYIEVDPYQKPPSLLEVNPRGLVPAIRHGDWGSYESSVLLEYLEDLSTDPPLLPKGDAKLRAHCRVWADFVNRHIVPNFYRVLQEQNEQTQISNAQELRDSFNTLVAAADPQGPFFLGPNMTFVDIQVAPWIIRLSRVLRPYRGWPDPEPGSRWAAWVEAIEADEHVKATTSTDDLYLDSYERYAQNRPNTSQLANAINSGRSLP